MLHTYDLGPKESPDWALIDEMHSHHATVCTRGKLGTIQAALELSFLCFAE